MVRIGLATPGFPRSLEHAVEQVETYIAQAAARRVALLCFPESFVPGMRGIDEPVAPHSAAGLASALNRTCSAARHAGIAVILPMDLDRDGKIQNAAAVIGPEGELRGYQTKNQLDPCEDAIFIPGHDRRLFELAGVTFGIAICHEGFRYPESVRWAAVRGASLVFHPHCTGSNHTGRKLTTWRGPDNGYYEHAMMCRAMENNIYFASINYAFAFQESATCMIAPSGELVAAQPYGEAGLLVVDIPARADRRLALRYNPAVYES
jgi:predicted amidohydrolase